MGRCSQSAPNTAPMFPFGLVRLAPYRSGSGLCRRVNISGRLRYLMGNDGTPLRPGVGTGSADAPMGRSTERRRPHTPGANRREGPVRPRRALRSLPGVPVSLLLLADAGARVGRGALAG